MTWLIGRTGYSLIDVWFLVHFCFWVFIGSCFWAKRVNVVISLSLCLGVAFWWEVFERFAEKKWPDTWLNPESWWNAWIGDLLTVPLGVLLIWALLNRFGKKQA